MKRKIEVSQRGKGTLDTFDDTNGGWRKFGRRWAVTMGDRNHARLDLESGWGSTSVWSRRVEGYILLQPK